MTPTTSCLTARWLYAFRLPTVSGLIGVRHWCADRSRADATRILWGRHRPSQTSDDARVSGDRQQLRTTFDSAADLYEQARPDYPEALYDTLVEAAGLSVGDRLLEIGCATGKATLPLARRAFRITCLEIGSTLAAAARRNVRDLPDVQIIETAFETWRPRNCELFDLVFAATAWRWLDPEMRYRRAWELLRPRSHLAFWSATHVFPDEGDPFFVEIQDVYDEIGEGLPADAALWRPEELPSDQEEIERSGLFEVVLIRHFDWQISYDADEYLRLLDTFSGHIAMKAWQRDHLYGQIRRRLRERIDGRVQRHWGAVLHVSRRVDTPPRA